MLQFMGSQRVGHDQVYRMGILSLLLWIFLTQEWNGGLLHSGQVAFARARLELGPFVPGSSQIPGGWPGNYHHTSSSRHQASPGCPWELFSQLVDRQFWAFVVGARIRWLRIICVPVMFGKQWESPGFLKVREV